MESGWLFSQLKLTLATRLKNTLNFPLHNGAYDISMAIDVPTNIYKVRNIFTRVLELMKSRHCTYKYVVAIVHEQFFFRRLLES